MEAETPGPPRRALVFSGGGARGAYEAGVVRYLVEELPKSLGHAPRFDILCGTSVGAIHACYLAATAHLGPQRGQKLVEFWTSMKLEEVLPLSVRDLIALPRRILGLRGTAERMNRGEAPERLYGLLNTEPLERWCCADPLALDPPQCEAGLVDAVCVAATQIAPERGGLHRVAGPDAAELDPRPDDRAAPDAPAANPRARLRGNSSLVSGRARCEQLLR